MSDNLAKRYVSVYDGNNQPHGILDTKLSEVTWFVHAEVRSAYQTLLVYREMEKINFIWEKYG